MATLAEKAASAGLESAAELIRLTGTSRETLTNWINHKPQLLEIVLKGAAADKTPTPTAKEPQQHEPEQLWTFSAEDLQEQARLIERLTTENAKLNAELKLKDKKVTYLNGQVDFLNGKTHFNCLNAEDWHNKYQTEKNGSEIFKRRIEELENKLDAGTNKVCQCVTEKGEQCSKKAFKLIKTGDLIVWCCKQHLSKFPNATQVF